MANLKAKASQVTPATTAEGEQGYTTMSKLGALWTADWKLQLIAAGLAWGVHVGSLTASAAEIPVVGGGAGTVIDSAQPELIIGVDAGYTLIPMEAHVSIYAHPVDDKGINSILLFADRTSAPQVAPSASSTAATPYNLLDGSTSFPGRARQAISGDLTVAPIMDELLDYVAVQSAYTLVAASGGSAAATLGVKMDYMPQAPSLVRGPCQVVLCYGATNASGASGMGVIKVAVVPNSYFPVS